MFSWFSRPVFVFLRESLIHFKSVSKGPLPTLISNNAYLSNELAQSESGSAVVTGNCAGRASLAVN